MDKSRAVDMLFGFLRLSQKIKEMEEVLHIELAYCWCIAYVFQLVP